MSKVYFKMRSGDTRVHQMEEADYKVMVRKSPRSFIKVQAPPTKNVVSYKLYTETKPVASEAIDGEPKQARKGTK